MPQELKTRLWKNTEDVVYKVGDEVPENGFYACVPCGSKKYLKAGAHFGNCLQCFGKKRRLFRKGLELWERIRK
ncbi:MAG: hypothetical protein COV10_04305 [Candidatus Vogelbacteria bacterium CG10_big_fil_rev_8_21_14_0_10_51_16]|uniref:Uncharacterized protein n=1 Tax=Candidatus Vogelbacteria bacterium CG10_big_fil_rev_8_21_14_0_10_51_16 TaxID=1975045 RepID=A0A2H0RDA4_9BACT|nr:MAG: hypothetical protein COV10_04305 [Candidatus Vogelbacteria bacterium CG10_big_fil_rev_8_21_14_0_10_51_16]